MDKNRIFFCKPQNAYMSLGNCADLRGRPTGKAAAGSQPKLIACEKCQMHSFVDKSKVPTVSITEYMGGTKPAMMPA